MKKYTKHAMFLFVYVIIIIIYANAGPVTSVEYKSNRMEYE